MGLDDKPYSVDAICVPPIESVVALATPATSNACDGVAVRIPTRPDPVTNRILLVPKYSMLHKADPLAVPWALIPPETCKIAVGLLFWSKPSPIPT